MAKTTGEGEEDEKRMRMRRNDEKTKFVDSIAAH